MFQHHSRHSSERRRNSQGYGKHFSELRAIAPLLEQIAEPLGRLWPPNGILQIRSTQPS
jgi:hypothetical protein